MAVHLKSGRREVWGARLREEQSLQAKLKQQGRNLETDTRLGRDELPKFSIQIV